ncbi:MAG TPA: glycosyltransferase, partial [Gammaproteobacteria bacterium]|nr:glycosyltransferase [Gammaproteobacteria bacterium]
LVTAGENGLLVPPGDAAALAEAIGALYSDPALRAAMGERNKAKAQQFLPANMARRYLELYAELDARFGPARAA